MRAVTKEQDMKVLAILLWFLFSTADLKRQSSNNKSIPLRDDPCLPWQVRNETTGICKCVSGDAQGIVLCRDEPYDLKLLECFCMTYYTDTNQSLVGSCQYTCDREVNGYFLILQLIVLLNLTRR